MSLYPTPGQSAHKAGTATFPAAHGLLPAPQFQDAAPTNLLDGIEHLDLDELDNNKNINNPQSSNDNSKSNSSSEGGDDDSDDSAKPMRKDSKKTLAEKDLEILQLRVEIAAKDSKIKALAANEPERDQPSTASCKRALNPGTWPSIKREEADGGGGEGEKEMDVDVKEEAKVDAEVDEETQKIYDRAEKGHTLKIFKSICKLDNTLKVLPPLFDETTNEPVYYDGKILRPQWDLSFDVNAGAWGADYKNNALDQLRMTGLYADYLKTQTGEDFLAAMKDGGFSTMAWTWTKQKQGKLEGGKTQRSSQGGRVVERSVWPRYVALASRSLPLETSDVEDKNHLVADNREFEADSTKLIFASLIRRGVGNKKKVAANAKNKTSYIKTDPDVPALKDDKRVPVWAISQTWIQANQAREFEIRPRIDHGKAEMLQVEIVNCLLAKYPPLAKKFVVERPCRAGHGPLPEVPAPVNQLADIPAAAPAAVLVPDPVPDPNPALNPHPAPALYPAPNLALGFNPAQALLTPNLAPGLAPAQALPSAFSYNTAQGIPMPKMIQAVMALMSQHHGGPVGYPPAPVDTPEGSRGIQ
ncbi:hypothetical protein FRC12_007227 [Ceratobasidium sp. 428]|nr:hypothetical protein FRC12_007227 [Ceratobasidium sp. 428]